MHGCRRAHGVRALGGTKPDYWAKIPHGTLPEDIISHADMEDALTSCGLPQSDDLAVHFLQMTDTNIRAAVLTISDTRKVGDDLSGDKLVELLTAFRAEVVDRRIITDDLLDIQQALLSFAESIEVNLILTTGGTGLGPRDNTPEATLSIIEREAPGLAEAMRRETAAKTPTAILSRGICGIRDNTLIINLPGSPKGVEECFEVLKPVLHHAVAQVCRDTRH